MRSRALAEFIRFGLVGVTGLLVDIATLDAYLAAFGDRPYSGQAVGWAISVTSNWWLNRRFTFTESAKAPAFRQWAQFVAVNSAGAVINYTVYSALVTWVPACRQSPSLGVAAGVLAGLALNFTGSRTFVFNRDLLR